MRQDADAARQDEQATSELGREAELAVDDGRRPPGRVTCFDGLRGQVEEGVYEVPVAPVLIAAILGPMAETELTRTLAVSEGNLTALAASPITITIYLALLVTVCAVFISRLRARRSVDV